MSSARAGHDRSGAQQNRGALLRRRLPPCRKATRRSVKCPVQVGGVRQGQFAQSLQRRGIDDSVRATMADGNPLAVDDHAKFRIGHYRPLFLK